MPSPQDESAFAAIYLAALARWLAKVAAVVLPNLNLSNIWSLLPDWEREVDTLMPVLARIAGQGWSAAMNDLELDGPRFDVTNPVVEDQLRRTRNLMVRTPDDVYRMILAELDKNVGNPVAQQAAVRNILNVTGTANWPSRAKTVSVTEVGRVFHMGSLALAMQAPGQIVKKWIAEDDTKTRPEHAHADNQQRNVFQPFLVGEFPLMAPGDPSGPPHLVINCRCRLSYTKGA